MYRLQGWWRNSLKDKTGLRGRQKPDHKGVLHLAKEFRLIIRGVVNYSGILSSGL